MEPPTNNPHRATIRIGRRRFLLWGAAAAGVVGAAYAGGWWWFKVRTGDTEDLIVSVLRRHLGSLPISETDMRRFARKQQKRFAPNHRLAMLGMLGPVYERINIFELLPGSRVSFRRFEDVVVGEFLLSTDFFTREPNSGGALTYLGPYDPYERLRSQRGDRTRG